MTTELLIGTRKGLFRVGRQAGGSWAVRQAELLGSPVTMVLQRGPIGYAALEHGHYGVKLMRRQNGGDWQEAGVPQYPPRPADAADRDPVGQQAVPWDLKRIWSLEPDPRTEHALWCGTIPGGLFHSADAGANWSLVRPLWDHPARAQWFGGGAEWPGIHSILVDPRTADCVRIGVSCGGMWMTQDGGAHWENRSQGMRAVYMPPEQAYEPNVQDPHCIVQCAAAPDYLWTQHHNGIFRSSDGGLSWTEINAAQPSSFGFAVAVHPQNPDTAWFVPAARDDARHAPAGAVVVSRTCDGGRTFEVLRQGLPQQHAYDLVYRHGLAVDASGRCLAFGSTSGGLWISEDGGDSWSAINARLPPIYCVRFAG